VSNAKSVDEKASSCCKTGIRASNEDSINQKRVAIDANLGDIDVNEWAGRVLAKFDIADANTYRLFQDFCCEGLMITK
jgi:hypothetical protein